MTNDATNQDKKTCIGYKPFPWQKFVHDGIDRLGYRSGHIHVVKAKRQIGKSLIIVNELLRFSINYKKSVNVCLSLSLSNCRKIYRDILDAVESSGVVRKHNDSLLEIHLINGSSILFKSAEQRDNLRGFTVSGILCVDEAAYITDDIFNIIFPATDVNKCPILMVSTPRFREGLFYEYYMQGLDEDVDNVSSYDLCLFDTSLLLSNKTLEDRRRTLPKNQFATEYLGEFISGDGMVFSDFKKCLFKPDTLGQGGYDVLLLNDYEEVYIGVDWGSGTGQDYTVITGFDENKRQIFIRRFNAKKPVETVDYLTRLFNERLHNVKMVLCEKNSIGAVYLDMLKTTNPNLNVQEFLTTNKSKTDLINKFQVALEQGEIRLFNYDKQVHELSAYSAAFNPKTNMTSYNAPRGQHDDIVIALMLAYEATQSEAGFYDFSFI